MNRSGKNDARPIAAHTAQDRTSGDALSEEVDGGLAADLAAAAAVIGSVTSAAIAAALVCLQEGATTEQLSAAVQHAVDIAIHGVRNMQDCAGA